MAQLALRNAGRASLASLRALQELAPAVSFSTEVPIHKAKVESHETFQEVKKRHKDTMKSHTGWDERMASSSEAAVKADKEDFHEDPAHSVEELQQHSVHVIKETDGDVSAFHEEVPEPKNVR